MARLEYPLALQFDDKYGSSPFLITSDEELSRAFLTVLRERQKERWYPTVEELEQERARYERRRTETVGGAWVKLSEEELAALPDALKEEAATALAELEKELSLWGREEELEFARKLEALLSLPVEEAAVLRDGKMFASEKLAYSRQRHEYEDFSLDSFREIR